MNVEVTTEGRDFTLDNVTKVEFEGSWCIVSQGKKKSAIPADPRIVEITWQES